MTTPTRETVEANRALMTHMYVAAAKGDFAGVLACLADDVVVNEPALLPYGGTYHGTTDFMNVIPKIAELLDLANLRVDRLIADSDRVIGVIRRADRATGQDVLLAEESRIRDGKVVEINVFYNEARSLLAAEVAT
jgi:uncharacterized protein